MIPFIQFLHLWRFHSLLVYLLPKTYSKMKRLFMEYSQRSTIAGLHYAFEPNQSVISRVIWMASVTVLTFLGFWFSLKSYQHWKESPVLTTIASTGWSYYTFWNLRSIYYYLTSLCKCNTNNITLTGVMYSYIGNTWMQYTINSNMVRVQTKCWTLYSDNLCYVYFVDKID